VMCEKSNGTTHDADKREGPAEAAR
jgi:hypothetical protein